MGIRFTGAPSIVHAARHARHRHPVPAARQTPARQPATPMLDALGCQYPELSGHLIVSALDAATREACTFARSAQPGRDAPPEAAAHLVLTLARQRLDLARERTAAASRRLGAGTTATARRHASPPVAGQVDDHSRIPSHRGRFADHLDVARGFGIPE